MMEGGKRAARRRPSSTRRSRPREQKGPRRPPVPIEPQRGARALAVRCLLPGSEKIVARVRGKERESGADRLGVAVGVLARQTEEPASRTGLPFGEAFEEVKRTEAGDQPCELGEGPYLHEKAR